MNHNRNDDRSSMQLVDGRTLSYRSNGPEDGPVVFFFHGSGSSSDGLHLARRTGQRGMRLISPARPGMGASSFDPDRKLVDWADDIEQLADRLEVDRFSVLGFSGGAPYAGAVAGALPDRVVHASLLSCGGPFDFDDALSGMAGPNRMTWFLADRAPAVLRFFLGRQAKAVDHKPETLIKNMIRGLRGADRAAVEALSQPDRLSFFVEPMAEALEQGPAGLVHDMAVLRRPWGFDPGTIRAPVHLWHGVDDSSAPIAMARRLSEVIPDCRTQLLAGEGHLSVILRYIDQALDRLLAAPSIDDPTDGGTIDRGP